MLTDKKIIMLVEDSPEDFEAVRRAFKKAEVSTSLVRFESGDEALNYLFNREPDGVNKTPPLPSLILLDLNLPGLDGRGVLHKIKGDSALHTIPIIVFTTSRDEKDVDFCYEHGANGYIQKPICMEELVSTLRRFHSFWFETAILPDLGNGIE